jgi:hypothetical protein
MYEEFHSWMIAIKDPQQQKVYGKKNTSAPIGLASI